MRSGGEAEFKKSGEKYAELDMDGWYAGVGVVVQFWFCDILSQNVALCVSLCHEKGVGTVIFYVE